MKHLLNCTNCNWSKVVEGNSSKADINRESHEKSIRNAQICGPFCPRNSVAWVTLSEKAEVTS